MPFSADLFGQLELPESFEISVFPQGLNGPRMMAVDPDGTVYVTEPASGKVLVLRVADGDGASEESMRIASEVGYSTTARPTSAESPVLRWKLMDHYWSPRTPTA